MTPLKDLVELIKLADNIRVAQNEYMKNRGSEEHGKAVYKATKAYDDLRKTIQKDLTILDGLDIDYPISNNRPTINRHLTK